jgi:hypothetical protein
MGYRFAFFCIFGLWTPFKKTAFAQRFFLQSYFSGLGVFTTEYSPKKIQKRAPPADIQPTRGAALTDSCSLVASTFRNQSSFSSMRASVVFIKKF